MKKIVLSIIFCLITLLAITGCSDNKPQLVDEKSVFDYLVKHYPEETFEIIDKQEIEITDGGCNETKKGNSWTIKSKNTSLEFTLKDSYEFNSFTCVYNTVDDYLEIARDAFLQKNNDSRIKSYYSGINTIGFAFNREDFRNANEMIDFVYNIVKELNQTYPFKYSKLVYLSIDSKNNVNKPYELSEVSSIEKISEIINKL